MPKFERWMALPGALVLAGLAGAITKLVYGEHALGTSAAVPWGSLIAGYVFFAAAATGVGLIGAAGHFSSRPALNALEKPSLFLALALLLCGFGLIGIELGNPFHLIYIVFSPNLQSGIWWMGLLYSIYLALLLVECYFSQTGSAHRSMKAVAAVAVVNKLAAVTNLGAIFALAAARPFWQGFYFPLYILLTAVLSGAAVLTAAVWLSARRRGEEADGAVLAALGKIMLTALIVTLLANAGKAYLGLASSVSALREATAALVSGPLALRFWVLEVGLGLLVPLALLVRRGGGLNVFKAAVMVLIGVFFMRLDFIMAGQMVPQVVVEGVQHTLLHTYSPSWAEWALIGGAAGAAALLYAFAATRFELGSDAVTAPVRAGAPESAPAAAEG